MPNVMLRLFPRSVQFLFIKKFRRVIDDNFVRPIVFAKKDFASKVHGIKVVQPFKKALVEFSIEGKRAKDFRTQLHVIPGHDNPGDVGFGQG